ncbi:MAG: hypothetical protein AMJ64_15805, partial [Betaproteobacteria bacterium SG8_39]
SDEDRRNADRVPGLGDLPTLGRLFSSQRDENIKTQLVLLITPRLLRTLAQPAAHAVEFSAKDAEAVTQAVPAAPRAPPRVQPPAPPAPAAPAPPQGSQMRPFGGVVTPGNGDAPQR